MIVLVGQKERSSSRFADDPQIDATDLRIVHELQANARLSLVSLGRRVGLSAQAAAERVRRLERAGVITGYRAEVDPRRLGLGLGVVMRVRPAPRQLEKVADVARATAEVVECHRVTGDDCYVMTVFVRDVEHLERVIDRFTPWGQTTTAIMQSSPVRRRPLQPGTGSS
jgi:Lrp/AsnC family transcriptional regulator, leucine-responsive regulatory protein